MNERLRSGSIVKNATISILAQAVSLACGLVLQMIVPHYIDQYQYSYWQTYVLYVNYVGILHFGLLDGIVLRYSQYDYNELNKASMRSQFLFLLIANSLSCLIFLAIAQGAQDPTNKVIFSCVAVGIVIKNIFTYASYTFQITNRIKKYAELIILQRIAYAAFTLALICFGINDFLWYCLADLFGDLCGFLFSLCINRELFVGRLAPIKTAWIDLKENISAGVLLLVANWSANLIVGCAKMVVQWECDPLAFGQASFAFSIVNLFLAFVSAISVVLFPSLKRLKEDELPRLYVRMRKGVSVFLIYIMSLYFPCCFILERWLPEYEHSLVYVGMLLPTIIYSAKISLLTNTYLKCYRQEKQMFRINAISIAIAASLYAISYYVFHSIDAVLLGVFISTAIRSFLSERAVSRIIIIKKDYTGFYELIISIIFIIAVKFMPRSIAGVIYVLCVGVYTYINRHQVLAFIRKMRRQKNI